jgi:hypothetical protein
MASYGTRSGWTRVRLLRLLPRTAG